MFYRGEYVDSGDGRELGMKRQRGFDQGSSYYGTSSYMYNPPPPTPPPLPPLPHSYTGQHPQPLPVVRLRGLPYDCSEDDIVKFFHGLDVIDILFVRNGRKFTGEAYCVLGYPVQVDLALQRNRQKMGWRYIEVFKSRRQAYYMAIANELSDACGGGGTAGGASHDEGNELVDHTGVLRLRGLPFSASKEDIMNFFQDFVLSESSIHITAEPGGRPSGEAFVEFASPEESRAAMAKDRMKLWNRYIELFPSTFGELEEAISIGW